jgi:O-antigen/teichoic acid export membrane protein
MKCSIFSHTKTIFSLATQAMKSSFAKNVGVLTTGTIIAQGITITTTLILSRLFTPSEYGLFALFGAVSAIVGTIVSLSYPIRIILPNRDHEAIKLLLISLLLSIFLGMTILLVTKFLPDEAIAWLGLDSLEGWIFVAIVAGMLTAIVNAFTYWLNRHSEYKKMAFVRIIQSVIAAAVGISFGLLAIRDGLLYAQVISVFCALVLLIIISKVHFFKTGFFGLSSLARKHKAAPFFLYPTAILDVFTNQIPFFLIAFWFTTELTGQYKMAYSLLALPSALIGSAISQVFYQRFSMAWPDSEKAKALLKKTWFLLGAIGFFPFLIITISSEAIFSFFLGEKWIVAGHIASILAVMSYVSLIHSPTSVTMMTLQMNKLLPLFGLATLIHRPLALYLGHVNSNIHFGLVLFVLFEILHMIYFQYLVLRKLNASINFSKEQVL